jgi:signal recognition particle subunit SRP68
MKAERAWSYSMELKVNAEEESRKRIRFLKRLRKAVKWAEELDKLCKERGCESTKLVKLKLKKRSQKRMFLGYKGYT